MKQKNLAMLGVAVGCGLVAAVAVAKLSAGGSKGPETTRVLVAKKDIPLQTKLDEKELDNLLAWADMPKNLVPPDVVTDLEQVKDKELNRTLKQGNAVAMGDLGKTNKIDVPEGFKLVTVKATQVDAVGGFAKPGSKVDIIFVEKTTTGKARAAIILRDMLVLALNMVHTTDEKTGAAIAQVESVSLAVTDKQGILVTLADERGRLKFVLRGTSKSDLAKDKEMKGIEWEEDPFDVGPSAAATALAETKWQTVVQAKKAVPQNTLVNADNLTEFFTTIKVETAPEGVVTNLDDLKGKFVIKNVDQGTMLYKALTDGKAADVARVDPVAPPTPAVDSRKLPRFEQVFQAGGQTRKVIWLEVAPESWKRFESEKEADEYKPEPEAPKASAGN